ncbi:hypothetical protein FT662_05025 [Candidozyma haemuli var. vulneris]|uniref:Protein SKT5 n=1 Tax=Candidozyma haemuli TaxID=45357 RepID=A0A2V1ALU5_9ASCO|nr:hypothetical protein CXQ85_001573 [[Candida] haemuloni]KAF3985632.1 hypothetical protein FT662_05025 [[Candida] haemuloni var. vulneris]PVH19267.1 hypothetical protein CXQ85_001573 [[Candida] haemuloni]
MSHPYRQKASGQNGMGNGTVASSPSSTAHQYYKSEPTPYPLSDIAHASDSTSDVSFKSSNSHPHHYHSLAGSSSNVASTSSSSNHAPSTVSNGYPPVSQNPQTASNGYFLASQVYPKGLDETTSLSNRLATTSLSSPRFTANDGPSLQHYNGKSSSLSPSHDPSVPYPVDEPSSMSQNRYSAISPPSIPVSADSSVTNLNLGQNQQNQDLYSRPEHNVSVASSMPGQLARYSHARSLSSSSSFFHDQDSHNLVNDCLGENSAHLMPRIKTMEMYRKNAKKSTDPAVLFQYAQYMLQTALMVDENSPISSGGSTPKKPSGSSLSIDTDSTKRSHRKSKSSNSFDMSQASSAELKRSLLKEAHHYLKRLSDKGYVDAQYLLGDAYSSGAFGKVDNKEAFSLFLAAAKHGHTESAFRTAHCYEDGLGTGHDARKGIDFLKMAASKNHPAAMYKLGVYCFYGRMGVSQNVDTKKAGIKWLERAANVATELTAAAPYELGKIYYEGFLDILIADKMYALKLFSDAAALGHVEAAAILGHHYEIGEVVDADAQLSINYYTNAAVAGHPKSMLSICAWYLVGSEPFLPKDEDEAFEWAKRAAAAGLAKAQFALANFYDKGIGCEKNLKEAQEWYTKAAENGETKALSRISNKDVAARAAKLAKKNRKRTSSGTSSPGSAPQEKDCVIV